MIVACCGHLFERCRACFSLADIFVDCGSLAASLLFLCGFLAEHLRHPLPRLCVRMFFQIPSMMFSSHARNISQTNSFCVGSNTSNPSNPLQPTWLRHRKTSWKDPAKIPQGPRTDPARNAEDPQGSRKRKNPLKATSVFLQRSTAPTRPLPIKQVFLHVELQGKTPTPQNQSMPCKIKREVAP